MRLPLFFVFVFFAMISFRRFVPKIVSFRMGNGSQHPVFYERYVLLNCFYQILHVLAFGVLVGRARVEHYRLILCVRRYVVFAEVNHRAYHRYLCPVHI